MSDPIFIVGIPRSGTTWLWGLFTSLPDIRPFAKPNTSESGVFLKHSPEKARELLEAEGGQLVEKTPYHLTRLPAIRSVYPNAPIVLIERDIRDVIASMINTDLGVSSVFPYSFPEAIERCRTLQGHLKRDGHLIDHRVSYEALVGAPYQAFSQLLVDMGRTYPEQTIREAIAANHRRSKIAGVYRHGRVGSYREELTREQLELIGRAGCEDIGLRTFT